MRNLSISGYIGEFRKTRNIKFLILAIVLVIKQGRVLETIYGIYCNIFYKPSSVKLDDEIVKKILINLKTKQNLPINSKYSKCCNLLAKNLNRDELIEVYGDNFDVHSLPHDFSGARKESIVYDERILIIGEYAAKEQSARIVFFNQETCHVYNFYNHLSGVIHIHSIHRYCDSQVFISTGDTKKYLDSWIINGKGMKFNKRVKKYFAGYTAATKINDQIYFGTDFSSRPNYIETLDNHKYFFPLKAYTLHVLLLFSVYDRYIIAINGSMKGLGTKKVLSIFDTFIKEFIFCEFCDRLSVNV